MRRAVLQVLRTWDRLTPAGGEAVRSVEQTVAGYVGMPHALAVNSGTTGLEVALRAAGLQPGAEVVLPAYDWGAAAGAVLRTGAKPVFADIDAVTGTVDPASLEARLTSRTLAVVVTHLAGCPADLDSILKVARRRNVFVLEDCAQALGAQYRGRPVGSLGDAAVFSFGWGKLVCAGEGGLVVFRDEGLWRRAVGLSQHPLRQRLERAHDLGDLAMNARMHPLAAAMVLAQWPLWPQRLARRRRSCLWLSRQLSGMDGLLAPGDPPYGQHSFHRYALVFPNERVATKLVRSVSARGWPVSGSPITEPLPLRTPFHAGSRLGDFRQAERRCRASLLVAVDWSRASRRDVERLADTFQREMAALRGEPCR